MEFKGWVRIDARATRVKIPNLTVRPASPETIQVMRKIDGIARWTRDARHRAACEAGAFERVRCRLCDSRRRARICLDRGDTPSSV